MASLHFVDTAEYADPSTVTKCKLQANTVVCQTKNYSGFWIDGTRDTKMTVDVKPSGISIKGHL